MKHGNHDFALLTDTPVDRITEEMLGVFEPILLAVLEETGSIQLDGQGSIPVIDCEVGAAWVVLIGPKNNERPFRLF